jgi:hypothetical protein
MPPHLRKTAMHRPALPGLLSLLLAMPAFAAETLPALRKGQDYGKLRQSLLAQGWKPVTLPDAESCGTGDRRCAGRPEVYVCAGTGLANCIFTWRRGGTVIDVGTVGEARAVFDRMSCRSGC